MEALRFLRRNGHFVGGIATTIAGSLLMMGLPVQAAEPQFEYQPSADTPGLLTVDTRNITVQNAVELDPCLEVFVVSVSPILDVVGLLEAADSAYGESRTYTLEANFSVQDASGQTVSSALKGYTITRAELENKNAELQPSALAFGWHGADWFDNALHVAKAGTYSVTVEFGLKDLRVADGVVISESLLDGGSLRGAASVRKASELCREWEAAAPLLAAGPGGDVVVAGQVTGTRPGIKWRHGVPASLYGNLASRSPGQSRTDTVRQFIRRFSGLYNVHDPSLVGTLSETDNAVLPGGHALLKLNQVHSSSGHNRALFGSGMTAIFDSSDQLIYLGGRFHHDLPRNLLPEILSVQQAQDTLRADLAAKGLGTDRDLAFEERVVHRQGSAFEPAYVVGVGQRNSGEDSYEYVISARTGAVREIGQRTLRDWALVPVWDQDNTLVEDNAGADVLGSDSPIQRNSWIRIDNRQNYRLKDSVDNFPSARGMVDETYFQWMAGDENNEREIKIQWNNLTLDRLPDSNDPGNFTNVATLSQIEADFTICEQIQRFWEDYALPYSNGLDRMDLRLLDDVGALGVWVDDEIQMPASYPSGRADVYTPTHEGFHHLEQNNVGLKLACLQNPATPCQVSPKHRMPFALAEGLAEFAIEINDPTGVNNHVTGAMSLLCLFVRDKRDCFQRGLTNYRKNATIITRPATMATAGSFTSQWPDVAPTQM